jgi:hypothetical protein
LGSATALPDGTAFNCPALAVDFYAEVAPRVRR